jgi:hypothetical protein
MSDDGYDGGGGMNDDYDYGGYVTYHGLHCLVAETNLSLGCTTSMSYVFLCCIESATPIEDETFPLLLHALLSALRRLSHGRHTRMRHTTSLLRTRRTPKIRKERTSKEPRVVLKAKPMAL